MVLKGLDATQLPQYLADSSGRWAKPIFGRLSFAADRNELVSSCMLTGERLQTLSELLGQESYC